jgi:Flp pilus assembly protein TadG
MRARRFEAEPTSQSRIAQNNLRRGAVAVEFACVAPLLLAIIVGLMQLSRVYSVQNSLEAAAREGARLAGLDRSGMLLQNQTTNQKVASDVKNYLASNGINPNSVTVSVVKDGTTQTFDLDDPNNELQLFQVKVSVPYSKISYSPVQSQNDYNLSAGVTFRNGRAPLTQ